MPTPEELRAITAVGKKTREVREEIERQEAERKARLQRIEQAAKEHEEAQSKIQDIHSKMKRAAENGNNSVICFEVNYRDIKHFVGVERIIIDHFQKAGFTVDVDIQDGPNIRWEPDFIYYLRVSW